MEVLTVFKKECEVCGHEHAVKVSTLVLSEAVHPENYSWFLCRECREDMRFKTMQVLVEMG